MNRRVRTLIAVLAAAVLCLGTWTVASAVAPDATVSATQPATGCATSAGLLRLATSAGKCPTGTTKVSLTRAALAPRALIVSSNSSGGGGAQQVSLLGSTFVTANCLLGGNGTSSEGSFGIRPAGQATQVDGTSLLVMNGSATMVYLRNDGGQNPTPTGAAQLISNDSGTFIGDTHGSGDYATLNAHMIVKVLGALYTITLLVDVNGSNCRVSAMIESATTG